MPMTNICLKGEFFQKGPGGRGDQGLPRGDRPPRQEHGKGSHMH